LRHHGGSGTLAGCSSSRCPLIGNVPVAVPASSNRLARRSDEGPHSGRFTSWLNRAEVLFNLVQAKVIRRGRFPSKQIMRPSCSRASNASTKRNESSGGRRRPTATLGHALAGRDTGLTGGCDCRERSPDRTKELPDQHPHADDGRSTTADTGVDTDGDTSHCAWAAECTAEPPESPRTTRQPMRRTLLCKARVTH